MGTNHPDGNYSPDPGEAPSTDQIVDQWIKDNPKAVNSIKPPTGKGESGGYGPAGGTVPDTPSDYTGGGAVGGDGMW